MRKSGIIFGTVLLLSLGTVVASQATYRLAGIIAPAQGSAMALIELPDGEQQLFRAGDTIENGRVASITVDTVRLEFANSELVLQLEGTGNPVPITVTEYRREDYLDIETLRLEAGNLEAISSLAGSDEMTDPKETASRMLAHLNLPPSARIAAVNDEPVSSPTEALRKMAASIDSQEDQGGGLQLVVSITQDVGNRRIYILTDDAGNERRIEIPVN